MAQTRVIRKKGFSFLSFFLGVLIGIILVIGAVGGAVALVLYADLDTVFNTVKLENKDKDGNYIYINTDTEAGGVKNGMELIMEVYSYATDIQNKSIGEVEKLLPVTKSLVDQVYDALGEYAEIDKDVLLAKKFSEFPNYVSDVIMDIKPATLLDKFNINMGDGMVGMLVDALVNGSESKYVEVDGTKYPVWYEERAVAAYAAGGTDENRIYFYTVGNVSYVVEKTDDGYTATNAVHQGGENAKLTGNYYYENGDETGDRIVAEHVTIRTFTSNDALANSLNGLYIDELLGIGEGIITDILGDISVGDIVGGKVDFDEKINGIQVPSLIDIDPDSSIMAYLGYGLSGVTAASGSAYSHTGTIDGSTVYITTEGKKITGVYSDSALREKVIGTTVKTIGDRIDGINVAVFMDIKPDDSILMYLGYGVTGVKGSGDNWTATYKTAGGESKTCNVVAADGKVTKVYYMDGGNEVEIKPTGVNDIGDRISGITDVLVITDLMDVAPDSPIMMYLGYGVTGVTENTAGGKYTHTAIYDDGSENGVPAYIVAEGGKVTGVYLDAELTDGVDGTSVSGITEKIDNLTKKIKIKDLIDIDPNDKIMSKLGEYTINNVGNAINDFAMSDFLEDVAPTDSLLMYLCFGITEIKESAGTAYSHVAKLGETEVYIVSEHGTNGLKVTGVYTDKELKNELVGTKVNDVNDRINGITTDLTIGEVVKIPENDKFMQKLAGYKIQDVGKAIDELTLDDFITVELTVDKNGKLTSDSSILAYIVYGLTDIKINADDATGTATYHVAGKEDTKTATLAVELKNTTTDKDNQIVTKTYSIVSVTVDGKEIAATGVKEVNSRVSGVTNDLTIGQLLNPDDSNTLLKHLENATISTLGTDIGKLSINELYAEEIYGRTKLYTVVASDAVVADKDTQIAFNPDYIYYSKNDKGKYVLVDFSIGTGKCTLYQEGLYTYGSPTTLWKMLLYKDVTTDENFNPNYNTEHPKDSPLATTEWVYTVNDMASMIVNVQTNIQHSTLRDLHNAGILTFSNPSVLDKHLITDPDKAIGDYKLTEAIEAFASAAV